MVVPQAIILKLKEKYPKPSIDPTWLQDCYDWVVEENSLTPDQINEAFDQVELQYLGSDLADSTIEGSGLPPQVADLEKGRLGAPASGGAILCQMVGITDIGQSAFTLRNIRQTRIDKADMAGLAIQEEGDDNGNPPNNGEDYTIPPYPRSTLQLALSDGFQTMRAIEYRPLPMFNLGETPLGYKVSFATSRLLTTKFHMVFLVGACQKYPGSERHRIPRPR
ncbi:hypothetical protein DL93DRAFT_2059853 [Clavulina sp. PMI_390]|nr:hypothetical protein DL93DRAFT_2059853 [Clavulina sp. PMI_390]